MKKQIFSAFLIASLFITSLTFLTLPVSAKGDNAVSGLALMLPESDVIMAIDIDKTLNVVGPDLLNQDAKKIENLKKLMKSLENTIGIDPYEIKQVVAGIKLPSVEEKDYLNNIDFTVIFRTAHSNNALLESWSQKIDAIEAFNVEKEPTEKYMDSFKVFRYSKLSKEETEKLGKVTKEFDELLKKTNEVNVLLNEVPSSAKTSKFYKDSLKKKKALSDLIIRFQTVLKNDTDVKSFRDSTIKLQNRWYEVSLDDPNKAAKLAAILKESKEIYPVYKAKVENLEKIESLINISNEEFYQELAKKSFNLPNAEEYEKAPNDMMKEKLDEIIATLSDLSTAKIKQTAELKLIAGNLQRLEDSMNIRLKTLDDVKIYDYVDDKETTPSKKPKSVAKSIKENAKITEVNGKRMITINFEKLSLWNPSFEVEEEDAKEKNDEAKANPQTEGENPKKVKDVHVVKTEAPKPAADNKEKKDEDNKPEKKKDLFAIGYLDETTMVLGYEEGIKSILSRQGSYKNPKAAEMLNSFKNPLISFAANSKIFQNFMKAFDSKEPENTEKPENPEKTEKTENTEKTEKTKKIEKKETPTDKFFKDINVYGSLEYDPDSSATNDLILSLSFAKDKVEEVFKPEESEDESSVVEMGDFQISTAIFYDLLNTLKAFKASLSFKFDKKKLSALIESTPQIVEEIRLNKTGFREKEEKTAKTKIQNIKNIEDLLLSPKFYVNLAGLIGNKADK